MKRAVIDRPKSPVYRQIFTDPGLKRVLAKRELFANFLLPELLGPVCEFMCVIGTLFTEGPRVRLEAEAWNEMGGKERQLAVSSRNWNQAFLGLILLYLPLYSCVSLGKLVNLSKLKAFPLRNEVKMGLRDERNTCLIVVHGRN